MICYNIIVCQHITHANMYTYVYIYIYSDYCQDDDIKTLFSAMDIHEEELAIREFDDYHYYD